MSKVIGSLKVYFENPFWIGVFEIISDDVLSVSKVTFGAEPKDAEVLEFVLKNYYKLDFSPGVKAVHKEIKQNPKRMSREVHKQMNEFIGTKSQQALNLQHEQNKIERKELSKEQREEEKLRQFEIRQEKKKQKHRGR